MSRFAFTFCMLLAALAVHPSASGQEQSVQTDTLRQSGNRKVGLVLSGGGAKGLYHIGVIKAL